MIRRSLFVLLLAVIAPLLNAAVTITYADIVDESPLTHSGDSVGDIVAQLKVLTDPELKAVTSQQLKEWRQALEAARASGQVTDEDYAEQREILEFAEALKGASTPERVRAMKGLVEPFLEQYAYVLESFIASRGKDSRPSLIDVGDLFPAGTAQPAWAYLVRTRRYHVLTDGNGFVRMYVPGQSSAAAYRTHYPMLRHVLGYLYRSSEKKPLEVEVYAYTNDFAATAFRLDDVAHKLTVSSEPARPVGRIALPLAGIEQFLSDGSQIEGISLSPAGELSLLGTRRDPAPTLEGQPLTLADLAVAYRAAAYAGSNDVYISLDTSPNPGYANVNFGGGLEDTHIGWVTLRADMRFKTISSGFDPVTGSDRSSEVAAGVPGFAARVARFFGSQRGQAIAGESTRFWFYPDDIKMTESDAGTLMRIGSPRYTPAAERQEAWSRTGEISKETPPWTADAIKHLNQNYDRYAAIFPELAELDAVGRLLSVMTWLHKKNAGREAPLDLDELLSVELPASYTPRRRPQMFLAYFVSQEDKKVSAYNVSHISDVAWKRVEAVPGEDRPLAEGLAKMVIGVAGLQLLKEDLPDLVLSPEGEPEGYQSYSLISGGLDLDPAKRLPRRGTMSARDTELLQHVAGSRGGQDIPVGGATWRRSPRGGDGQRSLPAWIRRESTTEIPGKTRTTIRTDDRTFAAEAGSPGKGWQNRGSANMAGRIETRTLSEDGTVVFARRNQDAEAVRYSIKGNGRAYSAERLPEVAEPTAEQLQVAEAAMRARGATAEELWKSLPADTPIVAVDTAADGTVAVLSGSPGAYRVQYLRDAQVVRTATDNALREFEAISSARIRDAGDATRKFLYVTAGEMPGEVRIDLGAKRIDTTTFKFKEDLDVALKSAADEGVTDIVVYRDALDRRPAIHGGSMRRFSFSDPLDVVASINETPGRPLRAHLANDIDLAMANHGRIGAIHTRNDVTVILAGAEANIETHGLNVRVRRPLESSGMTIANDLSAVGPNSKVILVWGNNDAALVQYLTRAGEAGHLKDKVMLVATCFAEGNPNLFQTLLAKYGPTAVMIHGEPITPVALQRVALEIPEVIRAAEAAQEAIDPARLFSKAAERVLKDGTISNQLRTSIEKLLRSGLQLSENLRDSEEATGA